MTILLRPLPTATRFTAASRALPSAYPDLHTFFHCQPCFPLSIPTSWPAYPQSSPGLAAVLTPRTTAQGTGLLCENLKTSTTPTRTEHSKRPEKNATSRNIRKRTEKCEDTESEESQTQKSRKLPGKYRKVRKAQTNEKSRKVELKNPKSTEKCKRQRRTFSRFNSDSPLIEANSCLHTWSRETRTHVRNHTPQGAGARTCDPLWPPLAP